MSRNEANTYDADRYIAEIYDQHETQTEDVTLIRTLIAGRGPLRILEPFCGNGRILIPLATDGHELVGLDQSQVMLDSGRARIERLPEAVQRRITLVEADVTAAGWPSGFDLVVLGANCLYELATPDEQERCIASAAAALKPDGCIYLDNNHMEGELDEEWRKPGVSHTFPSGTCADGTRLEGTSEVIWFDAEARLCRSRRALTITRPDGTKARKEWVQQKHPPSTAEMRGWLEAHGFAVEYLYGDRAASPYTAASSRAIFWARRRDGGSE